MFGIILVAAHLLVTHYDPLRPFCDRITTQIVLRFR